MKKYQIVGVSGTTADDMRILVYLGEYEKASIVSVVEFIPYQKHPPNFLESVLSHGVWEMPPKAASGKAIWADAKKAKGYDDFSNLPHLGLGRFR